MSFAESWNCWFGKKMSLSSIMTGLNDKPEESADDVIAEIDVVLTDELKSLYLLQYPSRLKNIPPYSADELQQIKFKPEREELQIQLAVDKRGPNYDRRMSEAIAVEANKGAEVPYFESGFVDKQLIKSTKPIANGSDRNLAVGRFERYRDEDGKVVKSVLHLTPIKNVLQMEVSCEYLDTQKNQKPEESTETKPITVRFAGRESDRVKAIRQRAYSQIVKNSKEEQWVNMGFRDMESPEADQLRMQMLCRNSVNDNSNIFNVGRHEYSTDLTNQHAAGLRHDSLQSVKEKTLADQVAYILCNTHIISFRNLCEILAADEQQVLRAVQQCACLVQGNWVLKSEVLYPKDSCSNILGVPGAVMRRSRNHLLVKLNDALEVKKSSLRDELRLPHEELEDMLLKLTTNVGPDTYRLKFERDDEFIGSHVDVVNRQKLIWEALRSSLTQEFNETRSTKLGEKVARKRLSSKSVDLG